MVGTQDGVMVVFLWGAREWRRRSVYEFQESGDVTEREKMKKALSATMKEVMNKDSIIVFTGRWIHAM